MRLFLFKMKWKQDLKAKTLGAGAGESWKLPPSAVHEEFLSLQPSSLHFVAFNLQ